MEQHCGSRYTHDWRSGEWLGCEKHLLSNPFRGEGFVHCASYMGVEWTWTTEEDDDHNTQR